MERNRKGQIAAHSLVFLFCLLHLPLCAQVITFNHDGETRSALVYVPASYDGTQKVPLVVNLHGYGSNKNEQFLYTRFDLVADTAGFILVTPDGVANAWNIGIPGSAFHDGPDDAGYLNALLDTLISIYSIDTTRMYSTGMSNGGFMSYRLACELPWRLAAIASVTGSMTDSMQYYCPYIRAFPVMQVHGTADQIIIYSGSLFYSGIDELMQYWVSRNGAPATPATISFADINSSDSSTVEGYRWGSAGTNKEVLLLKVDNGGHTWPGGIPVSSLGHTNQDISATVEIWKFFSRHRLPQNMPVQTQDERPLNFYPNPASSFFHLETDERNIRLYDITGRFCSILTGEQGKFLIPEYLSPGVYFIVTEENRTARLLVR